jgi:hypothetical protein
LGGGHRALWPHKPAFNVFKIRKVGWKETNPVPDPLLRRKFGSVGNRTRDFCYSNQELWPLDHRGFQFNTLKSFAFYLRGTPFGFLGLSWTNSYAVLVPYIR